MTVMTEEWVSFWYQCLSRNSDYADYCIARQNNDVAVIRIIQNQFPDIAEIYADFGDVSKEFYGLDDTAWKDWFEPRRHLFLPKIGEVTNPSSYTQTEGHILIEIPLAKSRDETEELLKQYLTDYYQARDVVPAQEPKYKLRTKRNGQIAHGYEQVRQACIAGQKCYLWPFDPNDDRNHRDLSYKEVVANFIKAEIDNLGWTLHSKARDSIRQTGLLPDEDFERFKVRLNRSRAHFRSFAQNTIRGRFPDLTPFHSRVEDLFKR